MAIAASVVNSPVNWNPANHSPRGIHKAWSVDLDIIAADTGSATLVAAKTGFSIYVTNVVFNITTAAAQTLTVQDNTGTPIPIFKTVASATGSQNVTFGDDGTKLAEGKQLDVALSAAGLAGRLHVEGYYKQTATAVPSAV